MEGLEVKGRDLPAHTIILSSQDYSPIPDQLFTDGESNLDCP